MSRQAPNLSPRGGVSDEKLAARVRGGDERAFDAIFARHHAPLLSFCRHMLGHADEAEDAVQQTFIRALGALRGDNPPEHLRSWLYAVARNRCLTLLARRRELPDGELEAPSMEGLADEVERREDLRSLLGDLRSLPDDQRAALLLFELGQHSHSEIAGIVGCPEAKVKALVFQARQALIAQRDARDTPCQTIRETLSVAVGGQLRRGPLRRHLRACAGCREFQAQVASQRAALALLLPVAPRLLGPAGAAGAAAASSAAGGTGGAGAGTVSGSAGSVMASAGAKGLATKAAAALAVLAVGGGVAGTVTHAVAARPAPHRTAAVARATRPTVHPTAPSDASHISPAIRGKCAEGGVGGCARRAGAAASRRPRVRLRRPRTALGRRRAGRRAQAGRRRFAAWRRPSPRPRRIPVAAPSPPRRAPATSPRRTLVRRVLSATPPPLRRLAAGHPAAARRILTAAARHPAVARRILTAAARHPAAARRILTAIARHPGMARRILSAIGHRLRRPSATAASG